MRSSGRGATSARAATVVFAALVVQLGGTGRSAAAPAGAATDAFRVAAPRAPWARAADLDPPGRLTWTLADPRATTAQLRVEFVGVRAATPDSAVAELLGRERADVADRAQRLAGSERGAFEPDDLPGGRLAWHGFRVHVKVGDRAGDVGRWVALSPDFPRRRRAFLVALDTQTLPDAKTVAHEEEAHALCASLVPAGNGWTGGLAEAWLDARVAAFAARLDSTTRLCWRAVDDDPGHRSIGIGRGLALEGDFVQQSTAIPPDSVVDAGSTDYGAGFDRNGDGRIDLVVLNRGVASVRGASMLPIVVVLADDDFDGKVDGCVLETGDADGDGRADHRLCVLDTDHDGRPDRAVRFVDALSDRTNRAVPVKDGVVQDRIVGSKIDRLDFTQPWRDGNELLTRWNRARASCPR